MATIFLQQGGQGGAGSALPMLLNIVLFVGIFYFLLVRPQSVERKRHRELVASLKRGDRVATLGGLVGEIVALNEEVVTLKTGEARVQVERAKIARRMGEDPATAAPEK